MELMDIYNSIKNPLIDKRFISLLIEKYSISKKTFAELYNIIQNTTSPYASNSISANVDLNDKEKFYVDMFNMWKKYIVLMSKERFELLKSYNQLDDSYVDLRHYVMKTNDVKSIADIKQFEANLPNSLKDAYNVYKWDAIGHDSSWIHVSGRQLHSRNMNTFNIEHRLYLNTNDKDTYKVVNELINMCEQKNILYYFKFAEQCKRDDSIVIYCSTQDLPKYIEVIKSIMVKYPDIKSRLGKPPLLTGIIDNYIGYGTEPIEGTKESYTSRRTNIIEETIDEETTKWVLNNISRRIKLNDKEINFYQLIVSNITNYVINEMRINTKLYPSIYNYPNELLDSKELRTYIFNTIIQNMPGIIKDSLDKNKSLVDLRIKIPKYKEFKLDYYNIARIILAQASFIGNIDNSFIESVQKNLINKCDKYGIDKNKFSFDTSMTIKFKSTQSIKKPVEKQETKPQKAIAFRPLIQTTYVPSHQLLEKLHEMVDYYPDKLLEFMYDNMNAIRILLPELVKINKKAAEQFVSANVNKHPELKAIFENALPPLEKR